MAEYRQVFTKMWVEDEWFYSQSPEAKLLFIYLFTNSRASVAGIYSLPAAVIASEVGLPLERVRALMTDFHNDDKIEWEGSIIWVKRMRDYQARNAPDTVIKRIEKDLADIPDTPLKRRYIEHYSPTIPYPYPTDTVPIPYRDIETETTTETEKETETTTERETETTIGASAPPPPRLTAGGQEYFRQFKRKRWATDEQRKAIEECERDVGTDTLIEAIRWAARKGRSDVDSICTAAKNWGKPKARASPNGNGKLTKEQMIEEGIRQSRARDEARRKAATDG